jgi:hypothetical protein
MSAGAAWCSQCYLPRSTSAPAAPTTTGTEPSIMSGTWHQAGMRAPTEMVQTRWKKTPTTFGPVGRVFWSVSLVIPLPPMIIGSAVGIIPCVIGAGIWLFIIMPWALRDIWKAGFLPAG